MIVKLHELGGRSIESNLQALNQKIDEFYDRTSATERLTPITVAMLGFDSAGSFAMLGGPAVKGANTKALVPFCAELSAALDNGSPENSRRARMFIHLWDFYALLQSAGEFFEPDELAAVKDFKW